MIFSIFDVFFMMFTVFLLFLLFSEDPSFSLTMLCFSMISCCHRVPYYVFMFFHDFKAPKEASRIHKDAPKAPQDAPKGGKMGPVHPILVSRNVPKWQKITIYLLCFHLGQAECAKRLNKDYRYALLMSLLLLFLLLLISKTPSSLLLWPDDHGSLPICGCRPQTLNLNFRKRATEHIVGRSMRGGREGGNI